MAEEAARVAEEEAARETDETGDVQIAEEAEVAQPVEEADAADATQVEAEQEVVDEPAEAEAAQAEQVAGEAEQVVEEGTAQATAADPAEGTGGEEDEGEQAPQATNAALRKATELGVDLNEIQGTGANGLITVKDVVRA
jgi:pyruvate/2-oxoglutarate dehydrogenase complex dihydrolipoamide acyltransferase (E2) component